MDKFITGATALTVRTVAFIKALVVRVIADVRAELAALRTPKR